jgi:hypothetical protein
MSQRLFAVDFGCSYTKVALRSAADQDAGLIDDPSLNLDPLGVCVPTIVVMDRTGLVPKAICGPKACDRPEAKGVTVYRNWKPKLFEPATDHAPTGLTALLRSAELRELAKRFQVSQAELRGVEEVLAVSRKSVTTAVADPPSESDPQEFGDVAYEFFAWLRQLVLGVAQRRGVADPHRIPIRLCIPNLEGVSTPELTAPRLLAAVEAAGWPLDPDGPLLAEPFANAIGILTRGMNRVHTPKGVDGERLNLSAMMGHAPLIEAYRASRDEHIILLIDIGTFTTDIAALQFNTTELDDTPPVVHDLSVPLGISNLDQEFQLCLPEKKADWFSHTSTEQREKCKARIYGEGKPYVARLAGDIGTPSEMPAVIERIDRFAEQVIDHVRAFCHTNELDEFDELILTGGGGHIPAVQTTILTAFRSSLRPGGRVHIPVTKRATGSQFTWIPIPPKLTRGATALGGCSIFFDNNFR